MKYRKEKFVKICPRCGSTNVQLDATDGGSFDICLDCNFGNFRKEPILRFGNQTGFIQRFPEIKQKDIKKFKKSIKSKSLIIERNKIKEHNENISKKEWGRMPKSLPYILTIIGSIMTILGSINIKDYSGVLHLLSG